MNPKFFSKPELFRKWLEANHSKKTELIVGFHKKGSGLPSLTWPESVDEALCFGWIDGIRKSLNETSYTIRFTPRKTRSHWSTVNIGRYKALKKEGKISNVGQAAYERKEDKNSKRAAHEQKEVKLPVSYMNELKLDKIAHAFFKSLSPSVQRTSIWWVISAKQEKTRLSRLRTLIASSNSGQKIPPLKWAK